MCWAMASNPGISTSRMAIEIGGAQRNLYHPRAFKPRKGETNIAWCSVAKPFKLAIS